MEEQPGVAVGAQVHSNRMETGGVAKEAFGADAAAVAPGAVLPGAANGLGGRGAAGVDGHLVGREYQEPIQGMVGVPAVTAGRGDNSMTSVGTSLSGSGRPDATATGMTTGTTGRTAVGTVPNEEAKHKKGLLARVKDAMA